MQIFKCDSKVGSSDPRASLGELCAPEANLPLCLRQGLTTLWLLSNCAGQAISLEIQQRLKEDIMNLWKLIKWIAL